MAKKISDLPDGSPVTGGELVEIARDGASYSVPVSALNSAQGVSISLLVDLAATTEVGVPEPSDINDIVAITSGATTIVETATAHGYTVNRTAAFANVEGMTEINQTSGTVTEIISTTQFRVDIDSSAYTAYTTGGQTFRLISIDGVDLYDEAVVFLPLQIHDYIENGVYTYRWNTNTLERHPAMNTGDTITQPYYIGVSNGDDNADSVYELEQTSFVVGTDENTWALTTGDGVYGPNYFLSGPQYASSRPSIARPRVIVAMDLPQIGVGGAESGWAKQSIPQLMVKAPRLSSLWKHANPWIEQSAFELAQTFWKEFVVDQDVGFTSAPTLYSGRRIVFEGTGFSGPVRILSLTRNLKVFNVAGTTDLWLDGHIVGDAVITGSGTNTPLIYADATFTNLRIGDVSAKGFTHAVRFNTAHEGFEIKSVRVDDTATEIGFVSLISTGSDVAWLGKNHSIAQFQTISADAAQTLKVHSNSPVVELTGTFTANRTMTLSTENVTRDATMRIKVSGSHAYAAVIGSLGSLYTGQECLIGWDGVAGAWKMLEVGDNAPMAAGVAAWLASPTSANLRTAMTDETGTGALVFQSGDFGTPTAAVLTNATGLPISTGVSGLGTGVATFLATPSSANLAAAVTDETGTGALVFAGGALGAATATSINGLTITSTTGTLTVTNAKTLSVSNTLTLAGTDGSTLNVGTGGTLGTAAFQNTGTSGANVPLLNGNNTYSGTSAFSSTVTVSSTSANSLAVGANGATNPVLQIDSSTASQASGLKITGATSIGTVAAAVISSGTNTGLSIDAKGTGQITLAGTSTGTIALSRDTNVTGAITGTSTSASALAVGPAGAGNPVLQVDASTASQAAGLKVTGATSAGTVAAAVISSGSNANLSIDAKGSGTITIAGTSTGAITLTRATTLSNALTYGGVTLSNSVTGTGSMVLSAGPTFTGTLSSAAHVITVANANALAVGANGSTNPVLQVDSATASVATGLKVTGAATGGTTALAVIDSGANANLSIDAKGSGTITVGGTSTGAITLTRATTMSNALTYGGVTLSNSVTGTGSMVLSAGPTFTGTVNTAALVATSSSATSFAVGPAGTTNPVLQIDSSTASQAAGLKVTGATSAGTVAAAVISSGAAANLSIDAKGTGTITIAGTSTGGITLTRAVTASSTINKVTITAPATSATLTITDSKTLSYDDGSWTPTVTFATPGTSSIAYTTQTGLYVKTGNLVMVSFSLTFTPTLGTASGNFQITGLPFTIGSISTYGACTINSNFTWPASKTQVVVRGAASGTILTLQGLQSAGAATTFTTANVTGGASHTLEATLMYSV